MTLKSFSHIFSVLEVAMDALDFDEGTRFDFLEQLDVQRACSFVDLGQRRDVDSLKGFNLCLADLMSVP